MTVMEFLIDRKVCVTNASARRLVSLGAVTVEGWPVNVPDLDEALSCGDVVKAGKKEFMYQCEECEMDCCFLTINYRPNGPRGWVRRLPNTGNIDMDDAHKIVDALNHLGIEAMIMAHTYRRRVI